MKRKILRIGLILMNVLFASITLFLFIADYDTLINVVTKVVNFPLEKRELITDFLPVHQLLKIKIVFLLVSVLVAFCVFYFDKLYNYIARFFYYTGRAIRGIWVDVATKEGLLVLGIPFVVTLFYALTFPVAQDEAYTYTAFTHKPFYYCIIFYPLPNNHVLYSILTNLTEYIPFLPVLFKLRLPALMASLMAWMIGYSFIKEYYSAKVAAVAIGIASVVYMCIVYGFMARGYSMTLMFFVIGIYAAFNIVKHGNRTKDWVFLALSSALGCYAVPSFLYAVVMLHVIILIYNYKNIKKQFIFGVSTVVVVVLFYSPIIVVSGADALIANDFVSPKDRMEVLAHLPQFYGSLLDEVFTYPFYITLAVLLVSFLFALKNRDWNTVVLWAVFVISPFVLLLAHSVIPFERTFSYYGFVLVFLVCISFRSLIDKLSPATLFVGLWFIQIASFINFRLEIAYRDRFNIECKKMNDILLKDAGKNYYLIRSHTIPDFNYEFVIKGYDEKQVTFDMGDKLSADTINGYDFVAIDVDKDETRERKPAYTNEFQHIYTVQ